MLRQEITLAHLDAILQFDFATNGLKRGTSSRRAKLFPGVGRSSNTRLPRDEYPPRNPSSSNHNPSSSNQRPSNPNSSLRRRSTASSSRQRPPSPNQSASQSRRRSTSPISPSPNQSASESRRRSTSTVSPSPNQSASQSRRRSTSPVSPIPNQSASQSRRRSTTQYLQAQTKALASQEEGQRTLRALRCLNSPFSLLYKFRPLA